jgi:hypothetical protein
MAQTTSGDVLSLTCETASGSPSSHIDALCAELTRQLQEQDPPWEVRLSEDPAQNGADAAASMTLTLLSAGKHDLRAQLSWRRGDLGGTSPDYTFSVVDAPLGAAPYDRFIGTLLNSAGWPDAD